MKPELYADALVAMVKKGAEPAHAVKSLAEHLEACGKSGMLRRLPATLARKGIAAQRGECVVLEVAHEKDVHRAKQEATILYGSVGGTTVRHDESIVGGWRLVGQNTLIDNSFKRHLLDFYRQLTR